MSTLIFGCGYLGTRVARLWKNAGKRVTIVTRSVEKGASFEAEGYAAIIADLTNPDSLQEFDSLQELRRRNDFETVLWSVGFDRTGGHTIHEVYVDGLRSVLAHLPDRVRRFISISSTGVFGQASGDWVDETTPCLPLREGGKACLAAEETLRASRFADRAVILRLAGIYGPNRIPRANDLLAGKPIDAPSSGYLNLIHVEDAARIVLAAAEAEQPASLYCVSDGQPCLRSEYYSELARLIGAPAPKFIDPLADSPASLRAMSDKRVSSRKLQAELYCEWLYPNYRTGLAAIVQGD